MTPYRMIILLAIVSLLALEIVAGHANAFLLLNGDAGPVWDALMLDLTRFSEPLLIGGIVAVVCGRRYPGMMVVLVLVLLLGDGVVSTLKNGVFAHIDRPLKVLTEQAVHAPGDLRLENGFPSGSSFRIALGMGVVSFGGHQMGRRWLLTDVLAVVLTLGVGYSRIYLGLHFPLDVAVGFTLGLLCSWLVLILTPSFDRLMLRLLPSASFNPLGFVVQGLGFGAVLMALLFK